MATTDWTSIGTRFRYWKTISFLVGLILVLLGSGILYNAHGETQSVADVSVDHHPDVDRNVYRYRIGRRVYHLPRRHRVMYVRGREYFYHRGVFYRQVRDHYRIVRAPRGAIVHRLPKRHTTLHVHGRRYYYANGTFYRYRPNRRGFKVVKAPVGAVVRNLPVRHRHGYRQGHRKFVEYGGVRYRVFHRYGKTRYRVVGHVGYRG